MVHLLLAMACPFLLVFLMCFLCRELGEKKGDGRREEGSGTAGRRGGDAVSRPASGGRGRRTAQATGARMAAASGRLLAASRSARFAMLQLPRIVGPMRR